MRTLVPLIVLLGLWSVANADTPAESQARGNSQFAVDLYQHLAAGEDGNLFFSPYSISAAFAIAYIGARGPTVRVISRSRACRPAPASCWSKEPGTAKSADPSRISRV